MGGLDGPRSRTVVADEPGQVDDALEVPTVRHRLGDDALDAAWNLVKTWTAEERQKLRDEVPKLGFAAVIAGCDVLQLAKTTVALAEKGLARRRRLDGASYDESRYLQPIQEYVARGITPAQELLKKFENEWNRSLAPVFKENAY